MSEERIYNPLDKDHLAESTFESFSNESFTRCRPRNRFLEQESMPCIIVEIFRSTHKSQRPWKDSLRPDQDRPMISRHRFISENPTRLGAARACLRRS